MSGPRPGALRRATSASIPSFQRIELLERRALLSGGAPPQVLSAEFRFDTAPHAVVLRFDQNVGASLDRNDLVLISEDDGQIYFGADVDVKFRKSDFVATFTFPAFKDELLRDGNYRVLLSGFGVFGPDGVPMQNDFTFKFRFLSGDANADGIVDLRDFHTLAGNFGHSGATFSQGDFDYDGEVDLDDFSLLASRFGTSIL
jgi:hypothetical protein